MLEPRALMIPLLKIGPEWSECRQEAHQVATYMYPGGLMLWRECKYRNAGTGQFGENVGVGLGSAFLSRRAHMGMAIALPRFNVYVYASMQ